MPRTAIVSAMHEELAAVLALMPDEARQRAAGRDFYVGQAPKGFILEARPGGRVYEDWGNDAGALWYTVLVVEPPTVLELAGHLTPSFGGPATTTARLTLTEQGGATVVKVEDAIFGRVDEHTVPRLREGWRALMGRGLKAHVERQAP